jgi:hypothetical protein
MSCNRDIFRRNVCLILAFGSLASILLLTVGREPTVAQQVAGGQAGAGAAEPPAPEGQTFVGTKECAACHFEQFMSWRDTKHAKAFDNLPAKYRADATCLKCHTTGHGQPTGFTSQQQTPNLVGNSCEGCHGPGSKHSEVAKAFGQKQLTPQEAMQVRDSIYLMQPKNVCVECHLAATHRKHPPYDKP